jgi:predicted regulator of Ras-like GTPase activity (Roadblock/LC7/MglB family)
VRETLKQLGSIPGVVGGLVMTYDGILVAEVEGTAHAAETAAYLSTVFLGLGTDPDTLGLAPLTRLTVWAAKGRLVVIPFEDFALAVVADAVTDIGVSLLEVASVARKLLRQSKIRV